MHHSDEPLNETVLAKLQKDLDSALGAIGKKYGIMLKSATSHLGSKGNRCEVVVRGVKEGTEIRGEKVAPRVLLPLKTGETREENRFRSFAKTYGIPNSLLNSEISINRAKYRVIGMKGKGNYVVLRPHNGEADMEMKPDEFRETIQK
jgi:hypothetical protein